LVKILVNIQQKWKSNFVIGLAGYSPIARQETIKLEMAE
jgi:hypothetical protein